MCSEWVEQHLGQTPGPTEEGHGEEEHHPELDHPAQFPVLESVIVRSLHPDVILEGEQAVKVLVVQNDLPLFTNSSYSSVRGCGEKAFTLTVENPRAAHLTIAA